mmetsp:Transcript_6230/g.15411  ORF Transcript_6230/g.15411 Transcript_6230/m.15411 type:complete len:559 (+) Transcript_6230:174-1850(+)
MIQRRVVGYDHPTPPTSDDSGNGAPSTKKRRRVRRVGAGRKSRRFFKKLTRVLTDEDSVITLIRITSITVIFGCLITLGFHIYETHEIVVGDDDDGDSGLSWKDIIAVLINRWVLRRDIVRYHLHREPERSGESNKHFYNKDGEEFENVPPSKYYTIPESMPHIGDKSDAYAKLRKEYDAMDLPKVEPRYNFKTMPMDAVGTENPAPYDIHDCPEHPPEHYPYSWNLLQILDHWSPDNVEVPDDLSIYQGLCVFDFQKDYEKALNYRKMEVPYIVRNDPEVQEAANRWMSPGYLDRMLGDVKHRCEYSESSHFMYWNAGGMSKQQIRKIQDSGKFEGDGHPDGRGVDKDLDHWQQPTKMLRMKYQEWLSHANLTEGESVGPHDPHWYYRLIGCGESSPVGKCDKGSSEYLFDELPFFQPKESLYIVDPKEQHGIHCRFGMNGVIAENHFDQSRNAIVLLGGERRYILSHPNQCPLLSLLPKGHPSARHSAVDWCNPNLEKYPEFAQAVGNEVVLQVGDVMYLPTNWFHFIVSLNLNFQCNTRSGITPTYFKPIRKCGF